MTERQNRVRRRLPAAVLNSSAPEARIRLERRKTLEERLTQNARQLDTQLWKISTLIGLGLTLWRLFRDRQHSNK